MLITQRAPVIYTAGPIAGCTFDKAVDWRDYVEGEFPDAEVRSPMRGKEFLANLPDALTSQPSDYASIARQAVDEAVTSQHAIVTRDHWDVASASVVIANLLPSVETGIASIGTCFELSWCWYFHKPAVVAMQSRGNPNDHPFVREAAYVIVETLEEAVAVVRYQLLDLPILEKHQQV